MTAVAAGAAAPSIFRMPSLGADMEAGRLTKWLVAPGDRVARGDVVAVVDTEKADIEIEVFVSGVVEELLVGVGERVPVGTPLARLRVAGAEAEAEAEAAMEAAAPGVPPCRVPPVPAERPPPEAGAPPPRERLRARPSPLAVRAAAALTARIAASPAARARAAALGLDLAAVAGSGPAGAVTLADVERAAARPPAAGSAVVPGRAPRAHAVAHRMAAELGIDLATIAGGGPAGVITKADVERAAGERAAEPVPPAPPPRPERPPGGLRQALAAAMSRSNREIPHYYLALDVDLGDALAWLARANEARPVEARLLPAALLLRAVALAAAEVPAVNGFWIDGAFRPGEGVHLGVAISRRDGEVVVPAIHHADRLDLDALMAALASLVARARAGSLRSSEVAGATITASNLGDLGATSVFGVIYPPQVALVGVGRIAERPWAAGGMLGVRPVVTLTLAADHRASDGATGGRFLARVAARLADPAALAASDTPAAAPPAAQGGPR